MIIQIALFAERNLESQIRAKVQFMSPIFSLKEGLPLALWIMMMIIMILSIYIHQILVPIELLFLMVFMMMMMIPLEKWC